MKKAIIIISAMVAAIFLSGCKKEDNTKSHNIEVTIRCEVSGAFTKALSLFVGYTDFEGESHAEFVNMGCEGKGTSFEKTIKTTVKGNKATADIKFEADVCGDFNEYKGEKAPWGAVCGITVKADDRVIDEFNISEKETNANMTVVDNIAGNWAMIYAKDVNDYFKSNRKYVIEADGEEITCSLK